MFLLRSFGKTEHKKMKTDTETKTQKKWNKKLEKTDTTFSDKKLCPLKGKHKKHV